MCSVEIKSEKTGASVLHSYEVHVQQYSPLHFSYTFTKLEWFSSSIAGCLQNSGPGVSGAEII